MCGIFGVVIRPTSQLSTAKIRKAFETMAKLSESRGKDASGILAWSGGREIVLKSPSRVADILNSSSYSDLARVLDSTADSNEPIVLIGHTRMMTQGDRTCPENNQPVLMETTSVFHNGIIVNEDYVTDLLGADKRKHEVDTEVFGLLVQSYLQSGHGYEQAVKIANEQCEGANTYCCISSKESALTLTTTNGSMFYACDLQEMSLVFGSEPKVVETALNVLGSQIFQSAVKLESNETLYFQIENPQKIIARQIQTIIPNKPVREMGRFQPQTFELPVDWDRIANLRRCKNCILPSTFPGITFDANGICNKCNQGFSRKTLGIDSLIKVYEANVRKGMNNEILVPISGGRDSCYGLHYIKNVLGLPAIAYTYDWGFVTDRARRNISRMCGALGVEHILVAADIDLKRANVRRNVEAWMHKPELGMIPLFMAGDKHFFNYASQLRKERSTSLTVFSMNWFEQTGFKTGFAGVSDNSVHSKTHGLSNLNKFKLLGFYGRQLISNPRYLNSSISDSLSGFSSFYLGKMDYLQLFDYIEWDEHEINQTLRSRYAWESGDPNRSTWRVGDASAAFYNYIYLTAVGFTEFDTFRSNQIRAGQLSRESAFLTLRQDNDPNIEDFIEYCNLIDINPEVLAEKVRSLGPCSTRET